MIWFTWRQFRTQTWVTAGAVAVLGVLLVITGRSIADMYSANVAACQSNCANAIDSFLLQVKNGAGGTVYNVALAVMNVAPALVGIFWGAPLLARELESGTHRLAWNQSITRTRWLATKLAVIGAAAAGTVGLLSWAVTAWAHHIDNAADDRITPLVYGARGVVPIGYALFAFTLGVTAGMLIRRTVPAMAATLGIYTAVAVAMPLLIRGHLVTATHVTKSITFPVVGERMINQSNEMTLIPDANLPGAWVLTNKTITPTGQIFNGPADPQYCGPHAGGGPEACDRWLGTLGLRQDLTYHPADHFWPLQWTETGVLVGVAVLLAGFCFWWTRRRLT